MIIGIVAIAENFSLPRWQLIEHSAKFCGHGALNRNIARIGRFERRDGVEGSLGLVADGGIQGLRERGQAQ